MCLFELPPVQGPVLALQVTAMQISYMSTPSYICTDVQLKMCVDSVGAGLIFVVVFCRMWVLLVYISAPFLLLDICCHDLLNADAVKIFIDL
jgi:hypothetical protein